MGNRPTGAGGTRHKHRDLRSHDTRPRSISSPASLRNTRDETQTVVKKSAGKTGAFPDASPTVNSTLKRALLPQAKGHSSTSPDVASNYAGSPTTLPPPQSQEGSSDPKKFPNFLYEHPENVIPGHGTQFSLYEEQEAILEDSSSHPSDGLQNQLGGSRQHKISSESVAFASLEWLVVAMTDASRTDYKLRDMVLLLHPRFCTSQYLARTLMTRFHLFDVDSQDSVDKDVLSDNGDSKYQIRANAILAQPGISESGESTSASTPSKLYRAESCPEVIVGAPFDNGRAALNAEGEGESENSHPEMHESEQFGSPFMGLEAHKSRSYNSPENQNLRIRLQVLSVFSKWIKSELFQRDGSANLLKEITAFLAFVASHGPPGQQRLAETILKACTPRATPSQRRFFSPKNSIILKNSKSAVLNMILQEGAAKFFYKHRPLEVAMALTYIAYNEVSQVRPFDLVRENFGSVGTEEKEASCPTYMHAVSSFNDRVRWVQAVILSEEPTYPSHRTRNIVFFIEVATCCLNLSNFHTALVIVSALSGPSICLVSNNMTLLSENLRQQLEDVKLVLSPSKNYEEYRARYARRRLRPHVPLLPVITQDIVRIENGNKNFNSGNKRLVNMRKFNKIYGTIESFLHCFENPYAIKIKSLVQLQGSEVRSLQSGSSSTIDMDYLSQKIEELDAEVGGTMSSTSSSTREDTGDSSLLVVQELVQVMSTWMYPPPAGTTLFEIATKTLAAESQNLVATLDYLGL